MSTFNAYTAGGSNAPPNPFPVPSVAVSTLRVGFNGLGSMGFKMARNLINHHRKDNATFPSILVYNRTRAKAEDFVKLVGPQKAEIANSPGELTKCDVIITSLNGDDVVKKTYDEYINALKNAPGNTGANKIFVETSTLYPTVVGELSKFISTVPNAHLVATPVIGPPAAADSANLLVLLSGDNESKQTVAHLLVPSIGRKAKDLGDKVESAPTLKLIGNSMVLGCLEVMAEATTVGQKSGLGGHEVFGLIQDVFPTPLFLNYGHRLANSDFDGTHGFNLAGGIKDAGHIRHLSTDLNAPMPTIDAAYRNLLTARGLQTAQAAAGVAEFPVADWSSLVKALRSSAGLNPEDGNELKFN